MSRFAGGIIFLHSGAQHGPVVSHYGCKQERDANQDHGERQPDLQGFALVHPAPDRRSRRSAVGDSRGLPKSWHIWAFANVSPALPGESGAAAGSCWAVSAGTARRLLMHVTRGAPGRAQLSAPSRQVCFGFPRADWMGACSESLQPLFKGCHLLMCSMPRNRH